MLRPLFIPVTITNALTSRLGKLKWPFRIFGYCSFYGLILLFLGTLFYVALATTYDLEKVSKMPARTEILDRSGQILRNADGKEIGFLHGKNRHLVEFNEVSTYFIDALIAREDGRFRSHGAVDLRGIARSIMRLVTRGKTEGASTLTMQLSRNSYALKTRRETIFTGLHRKFLEIAIAFRIERNFSKDEIIEHYMNRIFWGHSIMGIGSASRTYFQKPPEDLTLSEAALLAGIIRAPNAFSPFRDLKKAKRERDTTLNSMVRFGFIDQDLAARTKRIPVTVPVGADRILQGSYALDAVRRDLERFLEEENIETGGLVIHTTLDPNIQRIAEKAVEKRLRQVENSPGYRHPKRSQFQSGTPEYLQGSACVIDNETGGVLAVVGGRNASESQYNRAVQARRPIASTFKPFIFLAAFDNGLTPNTPVGDGPIKPGEIRGASSSWQPKNSDGKFYRSIRASRALIESRNTSTIRIAEKAGMAKIIEVARQAGFETDHIKQDPVSYLGNWGATTEQVASAYTIFPNGGVRFRPYYIARIEDQDGKVIFQNTPLPYRATSADPAYAVSRVMEEVNQRGTARMIRTRFGFTKPSAGKTGTSSDYQDAWYAGYTSDLTCAVWVGLDSPKRIINGGSGARLALPIWADIMKAADRLPAYEAGKLIPTGRKILVDSAPPIPTALPVGPGPAHALPPDPQPARALPVDEPLPALPVE